MTDQLTVLLRTIATHLAAFVAGLLIMANAVSIGVCAYSSPAPRPCTFDGGGTIASGDAATTTEGTEWVCTDGTLVRVYGYGNH
jgi:hypothetical protein